MIAFLYALSFKYICLEGSIVENRLGYELASSVSIVIMKMPLIKSHMAFYANSFPSALPCCLGRSLHASCDIKLIVLLLGKLKYVVI